jgi:hypothetical protein
MSTTPTTEQPPGFDTPTPPPRPPWWRRKLVIIPASGLALILAASIGTAAAGGASRTGTASERPATPPGIYANANQIVQALKAHHVPVTNVVADSGFWSGEGATSGVWATTAPGDSAAVFGGSENPVQDTEIVVFQNHTKAVAYANLGTDPNAGDPNPDHETILGTNWAVDAATPAAPSLGAALGGTLISNVPASTAPAAPSATASQPAAQLSSQAATIKGCRDLAAWENGSATDAFQNDPESKVILNETAGTQFAADLRTWMNHDPGDMQAADADVAQIHADCTAVGVDPVLGDDSSSSSASAPASQPAPRHSRP